MAVVPTTSDDTKVCNGCGRADVEFVPKRRWCQSCFRERERRRMAEAYHRNPDVSNARKAAWVKAHPERERRRSRMRARRRAGITDLNYCEILEGDVCSYCGAPAGEVDHIEPDPSQGTFENLTAACRTCNATKGAKPLLQFLLVRLPGAQALQTCR